MGRRNHLSTAALVAFGLSLCVLQSHCVRAGFDHPREASVDSAVDGRQDLAGDQRVDSLVDANSERSTDSHRDVTPEPDHVDPLTAYGAAQAVAVLSSGAIEDDPTLPADMLEIYFERNGDIWRAMRPNIATAFGSPQAVTELNSADEESCPNISRDGLVMLLSSARSDAQAKGRRDIYRSTRPTRSDSWATPTPIVELNSGELESCASATDDELLIFFGSDRPGGIGGMDIYVAARQQKTEAWGAPALVPALNTADDDVDPSISPDGLVLHFASARSPGAGLRDIWVATRSARSEIFGQPTNLTSLNSASDDGDPWLADDYATVYFSSDRNGTSDIFVAER